MSTLSAKECADRIGTDARTLRKFMRSEVKANGGAIGVDTPGKGHRYAIDSKSVNALKRRFNAWVEANAATAADAEDSTESAD